MSAPTSPTPPTDTQHALPVGLRLAEFEIRSVLGVGGFGIVYHAFDHALERDVAIKEYMPSSLAARSATLHVSLLSQGHAETFALGLQSFVNEARLLARFDHPSLVKVHRFWEGNGTAYMVMPLYRGRTLKALRASLSESPSEAWLRRLLEPLLGTLEVLHAEGVYHRDIAPDNIMVGEDGKPVLLDFGAARRVIGDASQNLTAILKPSYAPIEQYGEAEGLRQGAWTDLYALGATLAFAVSGRAPQPATARALGTGRQWLADTPQRSVSIEFLRTVDWMMGARPEDRPQSVAALREVLDGRVDAPLAPLPEPVVESPTAWERTRAPGEALEEATLRVAPPRAATPSRKPWAIAAGALVLAAGVATAAWWPSERAAEVVTTAVTPPAVVAAAPALEASVPKEPVVAAPVSPPSAPAAQPAKPRKPAPPTAVAEPPSTAQEIPPPVVNVAVAPTPPARSLLRPRDQCEGRMLLALHRCLKRVCQDPALTNHLDCRRMREVEARQPQSSSY